MNEPISDFILFLGRFHPLLVHLPIGFIMLLVILELLTAFTKWKSHPGTQRIILALTIPAAAFTSGVGYMLSLSGGYDATLLERHMWPGIGLSVAVLATFCLHLLEMQKAYRLSLAGTMVLLVVTSHYGGSLTHGTDFLTRYAPKPLRAVLGGTSANNPPPKQAKMSNVSGPLFNAAINPFFDKYCLTCHSPEKAKGGLKMDSMTAILKGGDTGPALLAGKAADSLMIKRMLLPANSDEHMPPPGKPQPTADEIALLQWWIDAGASTNKTIQELKPPEKLLKLFLPAPPTTAASPPHINISPKPLSEILPIAEKLADELDISITALSPAEPWLQVNASLPATNFGNAELARLAPLTNNVRWLDLAGTGVSDESLSLVGQMKGLTRLHLERTRVSDAGLTSLTNLLDLQYLNLYGTAITDTGLQALSPLRSLKQLYVWQTQVTPQAVAAFSESRSDKEQIHRWQQEIDALQAQIKNQGILINTGTPMTVAQTTAVTPINTKCPITGKDVDLTKTSLYEGKLVAFCCDKCKAAFEKNPKPCLEKLKLTAADSK
jgi:uncharacterized membrane protein/YHS domain-containing protein